ncbi:hypothetical protein AYK61_16185 [Rhodococcus sp. SBT000017]|uniref:hypothetical protein n=1 Tax=unclassified Rhodococcus (in: high G+C Gram-positive bacteria) TaxID=192944 RepID=UPI000AAB7122|nr:MULTISPECIES: hypothetical protein [unclassified Rhodococcus (in: high G+C Gram-positive bacteria)]RMB77777.1 hypothetical protein AYK61_16185 [Rhodococcus sp. SBT000017]
MSSKSGIRKNLVRRSVAATTVNVHDQIEVFYQDALIHNTGYVGGSTGVGSVVVSIPAGTATAVLVRVTGPVGTVWTYTVSCPA